MSIRPFKYIPNGKLKNPKKRKKKEAKLVLPTFFYLIERLRFHPIPQTRVLSPPSFIYTPLFQHLSLRSVLPSSPPLLYSQFSKNNNYFSLQNYTT